MQLEEEVRLTNMHMQREELPGNIRQAFCSIAPDVLEAESVLMQVTRDEWNLHSCVGILM